MDLGAKHCAIN